jgi:thioredoxin 1
MDNTAIGIVLVVALVFTLPSLYTLYSTRRAIGKKAPDFLHLLNETSDIDRPLYFYFMSNHCAMCKTMSPLIKKLQLDNPNIILINVNETPDLVRKFYVSGTPTLFAVHNGVIVDAKLGSLSEKKLALFFDDKKYKETGNNQ